MQTDPIALKISSQMHFLRALSALLFYRFSLTLKLGLLEPAFGCPHRGWKRLNANSNWKASLICFLQVAGMSSLQIVVNVGPEFLQFIPEGVEAHLRSPIVEIPRKVPISGGIIDIGNGNRRCVARKLRDVKHRTAGVSSGDEYTADGIAKAVPERAPAQSEIARIYL